MNIHEAIVAAKRGDKVRRKEWSKGDYMYLKTNSHMFWFKNEHEFSCAMSFENVMADDWEVYKE